MILLTGKLNHDNPKDAAFDTQTAISVVTPSFLGAVAASMGDVNHDGNLDLVLVSGTSQLAFLLGTGAGSFLRYDGPSVSADPAALEIADMDGDGCDDLVIRSKFSVTVVHNQGAAADECVGATSWAHMAELSALVP